MYKTRQVKVGPYTLGTGNPVRVQSMCNTDTRNADATVAQIAFTPRWWQTFTLTINWRWKQSNKA